MRTSPAWLVAAVLYVAVLLPPLLLPIEGVHAHPRAYLREFPALSTPRLLRDVLLNVAACVPLGWLLAAGIRGGISNVARLALVTGLAAALSLSVETLQFFIASRYSSGLDVGTNAAGGLLGVIVHTRAGLSRRSRPCRPAP